MASHLLKHLTKQSLKPYSLPKTLPFSTSFLITKTPKKFKQKRNKPSPRTTPIQPPTTSLTHFEYLVSRDNSLKFLSKSKQFLLKQPDHILRLDDAGKLFREMGFPRGRKVTKFLSKHPLIFEIYRHDDNKMWVGFTDFMEKLLQEETKIIQSLELERVKVVKKLLMMSKDKRVLLSKIYHCRAIFGVPEDFRDWVKRFPNEFRVVDEVDGSRVLELVRWDPRLALSALEREFMVDEEKARSLLRFPVKHGRELGLEEEDVRRLNLLNTLPLVSPYSDGSKYDNSSLEAEKYRVGVIHEFLSLTLEKKASIHHIVEFKEDFCLTKHTYQMLKKQPRAFYLAGTEMNWVVFLKDGYDQEGNLIHKDPQVVFNERLYRFAQMQQHPDEMCCDSMTNDDGNKSS